MKIAVHDPLKAFAPFLPWMEAWAELPGNEFTYVDIPVSAYEMLWQHRHNDVVWYEFCDRFACECINGIESECNVVVRLHSYELFTDVPKLVKWNKVNLLLASSNEIKDMLDAQRREIDYPPIKVLANGIDLDSFPMQDKPNGTKIALVGAINHKKNLPLALYILHALRDTHLPYELHILGAVQDTRHLLYLQDMSKKLEVNDALHIHDPIPHALVPKFLADKDFILSTSLFESFGQGIMEGVATGCLPIIHNFAGAEKRFMDSWLFNSISDALEAFSDYASVNAGYIHGARERNRAFVSERFSIDEQIANLGKIIAELEFRQ